MGGGDGERTTTGIARHASPPCRASIYNPSMAIPRRAIDNSLILEVYDIGTVGNILVPDVGLSWHPFT